MHVPPVNIKCYVTFVSLTKQGCGSFPPISLLPPKKYCKSYILSAESGNKLKRSINKYTQISVKVLFTGAARFAFPLEKKSQIK